MSYRITEGMPENKLPLWLKNAAKKYGTFVDGRVNYTKANIAPIVMCTVVYQNKILLVKRGYGLADAEGYWSTVNGFIDRNDPPNEIVMQELQEELGLKVKPQDIKIGSSYRLSNPKEKRSYIVFPFLVTLESEPKIKLDREHTEFAWVLRSDLEGYHVLDDLHVAIDAALKLN